MSHAAASSATAMRDARISANSSQRSARRHPTSRQRWQVSAQAEAEDAFATIGPLRAVVIDEAAHGTVIAPDPLSP